MATFHDCTLQFPEKPPVQNHNEAVAKESVSNPSILKDTESGLYYIYSSNQRILCSKDLISWKFLNKEVLPFQAPGIIQAAKEYRIYCSEQTDDSNTAIKLMVSPEKEGPFVLRDYVIRSNESKNINTLDAHPIKENGTEEIFLIYGSHLGGIHALHLNPRNGMAHVEDYGICIAKRPKWLNNSIFSPYVIFNSGTGYYYLFVTYGSENSDANIRVARSRNIWGPYLDPNGRNMTDVDDYKDEVGFLMLGGYRFDDSKGIMAPARCSVLHDSDDSWYLVHQARAYSFDDKTNPFVQIRKMLWTNDGWPVVCPECYAGEKKQSIKPLDLAGHYELIKQTPMLPEGVRNSVSLAILNPTMPGVSSTRNSWAYKVHANAIGRVELGGSMRGGWTLYDDNTLEIAYADCVETYQIIPGWDWEQNEPTLLLTGKDNHGVSCFAKKIDLPKLPF